MQENKSIEEELETLISIYGNEFQKLDPTQDRFKYQIAIPLKGNSQTLFLRFTLPAEYPNIAGPHFEIASKWLTPTQLTRLSDHLKELYTQLEPKQHIIYRWTEWLRENTLTFLHINDELESVTDNNGQKQEVVQILHETPINDRKSKFQAHLAQVYSVDEVSVVLKELMKNKKIREATHNMYAYRIRKSSQDSVQEGSNDDGETGAGSKMLYVLQQINVVNVLVVVTRWFGGIELGADRFKHIANQTKLIVQRYLKNKQLNDEEMESARQKTQKKFRPAIDVLNRIKHDKTFNIDEFVIGYEDRFTGIEELPVKEFEEHEIPLHRIRYFKRLGQIVWNRQAKFDKIFGSGRTEQTPPQNSNQINNDNK